MQGFSATFDEDSYGGSRDFRPFLPPIVSAIAALAVVGCIGAWALHSRPAAAPDAVVARAAPDFPARPPQRLAARDVGVLFDPGFLRNSEPSAFAPDFAPRASFVPAPKPPVLASLEPVGEPPSAAPYGALSGFSAPLPPPRPAELGSAAPPPAPERAVTRQAAKAPPLAPADNRNFIEKLFGLGQSSGSTVIAKAPDARAGGARIAALAPAGGGLGSALFGSSSPMPGYDKYTAVYDISARVVYLPNGARIEAHSGLGDRLDDPRYVSERNRGATPPHVYELEPREASFHGVQALRLKPVGEGSVFGRAGLLAHPFMLGPNGDSNGCVSIKDYDAFLRAYQNGQLKRLAVVARL
jgi:hypothetical protein